MFKTFGNPAINSAGHTAFQQLIARKGDTRTVNGVSTTITSLVFLPAAPNVSGQTRGFNQATGDLLYKATFQNKAQVIYKMMFP